MEQVKKRILVAEDEPFWVRFLEYELKEIAPNVEITHAENGEIALNYVKSVHSPPTSEDIKSGAKPPKPYYDAMIVDVEMPLLDGPRLVRRLRDMLYNGPIIIWSAYRDSEENLKLALDIPVSGFCLKEGSIENLIKQLKNLKVIP